MTVQDLKAKLDQNEPIEILDVREKKSSITPILEALYCP